MTVALITGVYGQDGSLLAEALVAGGYEVHGTARASEAGALPGVTIHQADLKQLEKFTAVIDEVAPDVVFNLAGISSVAQSWTDSVATSEVSGHAVSALLHACAALEARSGRQVRFVQASSSEIFGAAAAVPQHETTPIAPINPYGAAKAYAHLLVQVARGRGQFASNAILYNHESTRRPTTFVTRKITSGVAKIAAGTSTHLSMGNLDAKRDWSWAPDVVEALVLISQASDADDFVIASGTSHTVADFVRVAFEAVGIENWRDYVQIDPAFLRPTDAPEMRGDPAKAARTLGWSAHVGFEEMVRRMVHNDVALLEQAS